MKIVFSDFDGTLTNNGKLGAVFFKTLELIEKHHSELVIVSGRSVSWGHFFLTHFPLKHAIMEGGGVIVSRSVEGHLSQEFLVPDETLDYLEDVTQELIRVVPETVMSLDSLGRRADRAIEFGDMSADDIKKAEDFLASKKDIHFSRSNVHINFWAGDISKANGVKAYFAKHAPHVSTEDCIFYGDAANDESMFEYFSNTVGVSNILSVLDQLEHKPRIVLEGKDNAGVHGVYNHIMELFSEDF
jgi:HAD superfamily hydrolase (TIGR01484 family)